MLRHTSCLCVSGLMTVDLWPYNDIKLPVLQQATTVPNVNCNFVIYKPTWCMHTDSDMTYLVTVILDLMISKVAHKLQVRWATFKLILCFLEQHGPYGRKTKDDGVQSTMGFLAEMTNQQVHCNYWENHTYAASNSMHLSQIWHL